MQLRTSAMFKQDCHVIFGLFFCFLCLLFLLLLLQQSLSIHRLPKYGGAIVGRNALAVSRPQRVDVRSSGGIISAANVDHRVEGRSGESVSEGIMLAVKPPLQA